MCYLLKITIWKHLKVLLTVDNKLETYLNVLFNVDNNLEAYLKVLATVDINLKTPKGAIYCR